MKSANCIVFVLFSISATISIANTKAQLSLPCDLPEVFALSVPFEGQQMTVRLQKSTVFGQHTRFLIDDGNGKASQIESGDDRSYLGTVDEHPDFTVSAVLTKEGLIANIIRPYQEAITVEPLNNKLHMISIGESADYSDFSEGMSSTDIDSDTIAASIAPITTVPYALVCSTQAAIKDSTATLRPTRKMRVLEFEVGVEIGSKAFFAESAYKGNLETAKAIAQSVVTNLDARYLRGAGIKFRLGSVMIRTNAETDPLRNKVTATGTKGNSSLAEFKNYWNSHPEEVGKTHDLAVYHVKYPPSGLSYMNSIGGKNCYATCGGNGATSWANGTVTHEFGHSWGLKHNNSSGMFYESKR